MAALPPPPLDETVYQQPEIIKHWVEHFGPVPMDPNMVHRYIHASPFFDHVSNNGLTLAQADTNIRAWELSWNRQAFEDDLRKKRGVEYMIVGEPQPVSDGGWAGTGKNGIYNIRKQERQFVRSRDGRLEEDLTTLGTYYILGENMYQAPSVGEVIGNRLVSATTSLSKFLDTAAGLSSFDPTTGYSYLPHNSSTSNKVSSTSTSASAAPTPSRSREGSIAPGADSQSLRSGSLNPEHHSSTGTGTTAEDIASTRLLASSLQLALEFGSEYMDENPLLGTPGNFSFTHSAAAVKKRRADEAAAAAAANAKAKAEKDGSGVVEKKPAPSPPAVMTEAKAGGKDGVREREREKDRRGSRMGEKVRKRKSKATNVLTPGGASSAGGSAGATV
jgi:mediator of RNA polymerase II transcription subunit 6